MVLNDMAVATTLGTLAAMVLVPLKSLGPDGWKIAAALMSRHIGGGLVFICFSEFFLGFGRSERVQLYV